MKIYELAWMWYEGYEPHLFTSDEDKTEEEWKRDCVEAIKKVGDKYIENEDGWVSMPSWVEEACKELEKMGYKRIEPVRYSVWGGYIINDTSEDVKKIIGEKLFNKAFEKNKRFEKKMFEEIEKRKVNTGDE